MTNVRYLRNVVLPATDTTHEETFWVEGKAPEYAVPVEDRLFPVPNRRDRRAAKKKGG